MRLSRLLAVIRKEFVQVFRDPRIYPIIFIAPILQLFLYGYAATFDLHRLPIAAIDADGTAESRALLRAIEAPGDFRIAFRPRTIDEAEALVDRGATRLVVVIQPGLGARVRDGERAQVGILLDGTDSNTATIARSTLEALVARHAIDVRLAEARSREPAVAALLDPLRGPEGLPEALEMRTRILYNPELRSANYMVPGVVVIILLVMTTTLSALSIVKEKEIGTFEMLLATPIQPGELIAGKLAPFVVIGFADVIIVLLVAAFWFGVPIRGSVALLLALSGAFIMATIAGGLFVSTVADTQQHAMTLSFLMLVPMVLLSGLIFPVDAMPRPVQLLSQAFPIRHFLEAVRAIFLRGVGLEVLWPKALATAGLGTAMLAGALLRFRTRM